MELIFLHQQYLYLLLFVALIIASHYLVVRLFPKKAIPFANYQTLSRISKRYAFSYNNSQLFLRAIAITLIIFAMAGAAMRLHINGFAPPTIILVDASESMVFNDNFNKTKKFIEQIPVSYGEMGIITFSTISTINLPIQFYQKSTFDLGARNLQLHGISGTDTGTALLTAMQQLLPYEDDTRIILFTDGTNALGTDISQATQVAIDNNIHVHVIIMGSSELPTKRTTIEQLKNLILLTDGTINISPLSMNIEERESVLVKIDLYLMILAMILLTIEWVASKTIFKTVPHDR